MLARLALAIGLIAGLAAPAAAERVVLGLSQDEVAITARFDGSDILIFGAIKREGGEIPPTGNLGVIVTVAGPDEALTVREKERKFGIWVNSGRADITHSPSFYAVASNKPLNLILRDTEDLQSRISTQRAITGISSPSDPQPYVDALIRIRSAEERFQFLRGRVEVTDEVLFRTNIDMPAKLTEGDYQATIYLTRGGTIVDVYETTIPVRKVGLERWLYNLAQSQPFIYGLMSLVIAGLAGWGASAAFQFVRR